MSVRGIAVLYKEDEHENVTDKHARHDERGSKPGRTRMESAMAQFHIARRISNKRVLLKRRIAEGDDPHDGS